MNALLLRNAEIGGVPGQDVFLKNGLIAQIGQDLRAGDADEIECRGGALIPGLADHHCHILAGAARAASIDLGKAASLDEAAGLLRAAAAAIPVGSWLRAVACPRALAQALSREMLDTWTPDIRLRLQDQSGSLWLLNSMALADIDPGRLPAGVERDSQDRPTGRIWRGDAWLGAQIGETAPDLAPLGKKLAALGITSLTDTSANTDFSRAALLAAGFRSGALPQRLTLMSGGELAAPIDAAFTVGPVKILLDDHDLPEFDEYCGRIAQARQWGRAVAVHCVTASELALTLAAFETAGAKPGDRIEHGGIIPATAIPAIRALGLTVVTQPGFVHERGDRYLAEVDPDEVADLYRCASLQAAGIAVAGSSDAPYTSWDCWQAMQTATRRQTAGGQSLGSGERIPPHAALALYLGRAADPGGPPRIISAGAAADLCLLHMPIRAALTALTASAVAMTLIGGRIVYRGY